MQETDLLVEEVDVQRFRDSELLLRRYRSEVVI